MQKDFHYYCVAVLARAAGFHPADALVIAYASQYVDNAVESAPITIGEDKEHWIHFDPVRTAPVVSHTDVLEAQDSPGQWDRIKILFGNVSWSTQKRVHMAFHFLPPRPLPDKPVAFEYRTRPNPPLAQALLAYAAGEKHPRRRRCAIGIALHTFADSWAHQNFSGRQHPENDVNEIYTRDPLTGEWELLGQKLDIFSILKQLKEAVADHWLEIGHIEALALPDLAYLEWKYTNNGGPPVERHNLTGQMDAAYHIYTWLRRIEKENAAPITPWREIQSSLVEILATPGQSHKNLLDLEGHERELAERCKLWKGRFGDDKDFFLGHPFHYDKLTWRQEAFSAEADELAWERKSRKELGKLAFGSVSPDFWDSYWVHFHRSARRQRFFVMNHLP